VLLNELRTGTPYRYRYRTALTNLTFFHPGGRNCYRRNGNIDILIDLRTHLLPSMFSQVNYSTIDHTLSNYIVSLVAEPITEPLDVMSSVLVIRYPQLIVKFCQHGRYEVIRDSLLLSSIFSQCN
jgi:hypothetical protein